MPKRDEPALAESAAVRERGGGSTFGEPGVFAEQGLQQFHTLEVSLEARHRWAAQVKAAIAVVVHFKGEVGSLPLLDHALQPDFESVVFRAQSWIRRFAPIAIEVLTLKIKARTPADDTVLVGHRHDVGAVARGEFPGIGIILKQAVDQAVHDPIAARLPRMRAGANEHAIRRVRLPDSEHLKLAAFNSLANGTELDERMISDAVQELIEVGEPIGLDARHIHAGTGQLRLRTANGQREPVG